MKKRTLSVGLASLAVAGLVGTGTFAAWNDTDVITGNATEAGHLTLNTNSTGSINNVGGQAIAPGESRTIDFFVASADLDGVPDAVLSMAVTNLADDEGSPACSNDSEEAVDSDCSTNQNGGEFSSQGYMRIRYTDPTDVSNITFAGNSCSSTAGGYINSVLYSPANDNDTENHPKLASVASGSPHDLATLAGDEGICIRVDLGLPWSATNAVMGDLSTFDLEFDLRQV